MKIFGKPLTEYAAFSKLFLWLIAIFGIARLGMSLAGVSNSTAKWFSMTVVTLVGLLYYSIRVHTSGFGSYKQLLPITFWMSVVAQGIAVVAIVLSIVTAHDNIFSAPEYSGGGDGKNWLHVFAHVVVGLIIEPLFLWLVGCVLMFVAKKVAPKQQDAAAANA